MKFLRTCICILHFLCCISVFSQEIPPIQVFTPQDYQAEDQNWAISQSFEDDFIYLANNRGLLEYNGATWNLNRSPNAAILRSVLTVEDLIFTGGYMDFGYWMRNQFNQLEYISLVEANKLKINEDEEFWTIISVEGYVLFQSFDRIYIYNSKTKEFTIIESEQRINKIFNVNDSVYFQKVGSGIYKLENGQEVLIIPDRVFSSNEIINMFSSDNELLLLTKENGFYGYKDGQISKWSIEADNLLKNRTIYSAIRLRDKSFMLGTISNGIIEIEQSGRIALEINQPKGLSNNTILSLFEDKSENLWLGLDNGINVINLNSPYRVFTDKLGKLGTVYASAEVDNYLYLGTNQGLFYRDRTNGTEFQFIGGTNGQVWELKVIQGTLFCGHDKGTFTISKDKANLISDIKGTWTLKPIKGKPNLLIQGNYKGVYVLERITNQWKLRNKIEGFNISSRYLEFIDSNKILVSHEYKGVYKIQVDNSFEKVVGYEKLAIPYGIKSSLSKFNEDIYYGYPQGVYKFNEQEERFEMDSVLSELVGNENYLSGKLIYDGNGDKLWGFPNNDIIYIEQGQLSKNPKIFTIPVPDAIRKFKTGYENILYLNKDEYLFGTTTGYFIVDLSRLDYSPKDIRLNTISYSAKNDNLTPLAKTGDTILDYENNNIQFAYSVSDYDKYSETKYQFRLKGIYDNWSEWSSTTNVEFNNLPHGDYRFEARAKSDGIATANTVSYEFGIGKPWYLKPLAITLYILLGFLTTYLVHYFNRRHYKRQKVKLLDQQERELELEQLENQKQLMVFKNKTLQMDIDNKNKELGTATMNLVKRNELLNDIKAALIRSKSDDEIKKVIRLINANLNNTSDWELFEEAFNNVDKDFMKRIKTLHPAITPNDLRLCAYLRLNLSSKEIAPLLNISHKSVEVKRYRLRKKMGLPHDQSLSDYIIEL